MSILNPFPIGSLSGFKKDLEILETFISIFSQSCQDYGILSKNTLLTLTYQHENLKILLKITQNSFKISEIPKVFCTVFVSETSEK
jgi:hypothetical protein